MAQVFLDFLVFISLVFFVELCLKRSLSLPVFNDVAVMSQPVG